MRVLVSAFEPFGGEARNSSCEALDGFLARSPQDPELATVVLPVVYNAAGEKLIDVAMSFDPHAVIVLGQGGGQPEVRLERVARNVVSAPSPDEAGHRPLGDEVVRGGPAQYPSSLPIQPLLDGLRDAGFPAAVSHDAGGFVCNHVFYRLMHLITEQQSTAFGGLIHLPCLPEQGFNTGDFGMDVEALVEVISVAVAVVRRS